MSLEITVNSKSSYWDCNYSFQLIVTTCCLVPNCRWYLWSLYPEVIPSPLITLKTVVRYLSLPKRSMPEKSPFYFPCFSLEPPSDCVFFRVLPPRRCTQRQFWFTELHPAHPDLRTGPCKAKEPQSGTSLKSKGYLAYSVASSACLLPVRSFSQLKLACSLGRSPGSSPVHQQLSVVSCPGRVLHQPLSITIT